MSKAFNGKFTAMSIIFVLIVSILGSTTSFAIDLSNSNVSGVTDIANTGTPPEVTALSAILIDADTGQILYSKDARAQRYPASTTKIMTALLAIENLNMDDTIVVDKEASEMTGSKMYLSEGEEITVRDLLYGLMLTSANDAAVALGKAVAGSVSDFVDMMNEKAVACGATDTHFNNTNGLPDEQHYTTAYDLAMITKSAFSHQSFRDIVSTIEYTIPATNKYEERQLLNSNKMLRPNKVTYDIDGVETPAQYEGTNGVKTGFTNDAGSCLVASVYRDGRELIGVVLNSEVEEHYPDMIKIMNYGFSTFEHSVLCSASDYQYEVKVKKSETKKITASLTDDLTITLPVGSSSDKVKTEVNIDEKVEAPVESGQILGTVDVYYGGNLLCTLDLTATEAAALREGPDWAAIGMWALKIGGGLLLLIILILVIVSIIRSIVRNRMRREHQHRMAQERAHHQNEVSHHKQSEAAHNARYGSGSDSRYRDPRYNDSHYNSRYNDSRYNGSHYGDSRHNDSHNNNSHYGDSRHSDSNYRDSRYNDSRRSSQRYDDSHYNDPRYRR